MSYFSQPIDIPFVIGLVVLLGVILAVLHDWRRG